MALDPITAGLDLAKTVVSTIWPDKSAAEQAQLAAALSIVQGQIDVDKAEALNSNVFVAGWRPFIGWACGVAMAAEFIARPTVQFVFVAYGHPLPDLPTIDGKLWELLFGMLGFGDLRTIEKLEGVA